MFIVNKKYTDINTDEKTIILLVIFVALLIALCAGA